MVYETEPWDCFIRKKKSVFLPQTSTETKKTFAAVILKKLFKSNFSTIDRGVLEPRDSVSKMLRWRLVVELRFGKKKIATTRTFGVVSSRPNSLSTDFERNDL